MNLGNIRVLLKTQLWAQILIAMILGVITGLILSPEGFALIERDTAYKIAHWLHLPGGIFLNLIQMVVIPLITSSIIMGICSSGDLDYLKKVGLRVFPYFLCTTTIAVTLGIILSVFIQPGAYVDIEVVQNIPTSIETVKSINGFEEVKQSIPHRIINLIPANIDETLLNQDMLGIVIYAIIMGIALLTLGGYRDTKPVLYLLETLQEVSLKVVSWAMMLAPYAVFGLLADITLKVGFSAIIGIMAYMGTVLLGLLCLLCFYLFLGKLIVDQSPLSFLKKIKDVQLLAFSTSSSAAVMPLSLKIAEKKLNTSKSIANFIIPLGATINMDGTALYQVTAAIFLTQLFGIDLNLFQIVMLSITTVGASIGSPSTPGVGIVILASILQSLGVPVSGIAIIIGVDRILDMCRTTINVTGDLTACLVMEKWIGGKGNRLQTGWPKPTNFQA